VRAVEGVRRPSRRLVRRVVVNVTRAFLTN
jgi:hypothetical protein